MLEKIKRKIKENAKINPNFGMKGKHHSKETKLKLSKNHYGHIVSDNTRKKISNSLKHLYKIGERIPYFKGKTFKHTAETKQKISLANLGHKHTSVTREKIRLSSFGRKVSEETRKKMSLKHKGYKHTTDAIEKMRIARAKAVFPVKDTSIEVKIQNFLKELNINFLTHKYINKIEHGYQCDILIPSVNLVIECDGDYWHGNFNLYPNKKFKPNILKRINVDILRTKELKENGYNILRLWGSDINKMALEDFKLKLNRFLAV
jgi:G:T-mismatch repair DNA endonuclease (very short patch repair protein)